LADTQLLVLDEVIRKRSYTSDDLEIMGLVGYEWILSENWSIDFQVGGAKVVSKSNPWPIYTNDNRTNLAKEQILPIGVVNITYWF
jgi:hypothetical protein